MTPIIVWSVGISTDIEDYDEILQCKVIWDRLNRHAAIDVDVRQNLSATGRNVGFICHNDR